MSNDNSISLNKFISSSGMCSRREADQMIEQGRVTVNGQIAKTGNRVAEGDVIWADGRQLKFKTTSSSGKSKTLYIALNKPVGIVCTTEKKEKDNIISFINHPKRLFPIGRLDKPSQGLIFLTNDGDIVNKILRAGNNHEKEYIVSVNKPITPDFIQKMSNGVKILGTVTKKCKVTQQGKSTFKITLTQGLNRQIRRMCEALGYRVTQLTRTRIMNVKLGKLPVGKWRELTPEEVQQLNSLSAGSSKTKEASKDPNKKKYRPNRKPKRS